MISGFWISGHQHCVPDMLDRLLCCSRVSPKSRWSLSEVSVKSQWSLDEVSPHLARSVFLASLLSGARQVVEGVFDMMHLSSSGQGLGWWVTGTAVILRSVAVGINTTYTYCNPRGLVAVVNVQLGAYFVSRSGLQARKEGWGICPALPLNPRGSPTSVPH